MIGRRRAEGGSSRSPGPTLLERLIRRERVGATTRKRDRTAVEPTSTRTERRLECGFCRRPFLPSRGRAACGSCPLAPACRLVRCPACGWENPLPGRVGR